MMAMPLLGLQPPTRSMFLRQGCSTFQLRRGLMARRTRLRQLHLCQLVRYEVQRGQLPILISST